MLSLDPPIFSDGIIEYRFRVIGDNPSQSVALFLEDFSHLGGPHVMQTMIHKWDLCSVLNIKKIMVAGNQWKQFLEVDQSSINKAYQSPCRHEAKT